MGNIEITLLRSEWEAIADRALRIGDSTHFEENEELKRAGSFPSAVTPEASGHWAISNFIRHRLASAEGDPVTLGVLPALVGTMRMYDYLPAGA
jgi:hypothetical protein